MNLNDNSQNSGQNIDPFTLVYGTFSGPELGKDLQEYQRVLTLDSKLGTAFLEKYRSSSDGPGEPIGTFRGNISTDIFRHVFTLVQMAGFNNLPPATQGGLGISLLTLKVEYDDTILDTQFSSRDIELLEQLDPLLFELNKIAVDLEEYPESAVKIKTEYVGGTADDRFKLIITNIGSQTVCISKPHSFGVNEKKRWAGVRIAELPEEKPGYTSPPLQWSVITIPIKEESEYSVQLLPGQAYAALTDSWSVQSKNVNYIIQGVFSDYKGPGEDVDCYPIRGMAFSEACEILSQ